MRLILLLITLFMINFTFALTGRFILDDSKCAGFEFNAHSTLWYNEMQCQSPDKLNITWISDKIFYTRNLSNNQKSCPPIVDIYQIISQTKNKLVLKNYWTGWGENIKPTVLNFHRLN